MDKWDPESLVSWVINPVLKGLVRLPERGIGPSVSPVPTEDKTNAEEKTRIYPQWNSTSRSKFSTVDHIYYNASVRESIWSVQSNKYLFIYFTQPPCSFKFCHNTKMNLTKLGRKCVEPMKLKQNTVWIHDDKNSGFIKTVQFLKDDQLHIFLHNHCILHSDINNRSSITVTARWTNRHLLNCISLLSHVPLETHG